MTVQPFTPDGVNDKQTELYALSDAALLAEAQALTANLATWLNTHFSLTPQQETYLAGLPDIVRFHISAVIAGALVSRGPIDMGGPQDYGPPYRTKEIVIEPCGETSYVPPITGSGVLQGALPVKITYVLVE